MGLATAGLQSGGGGPAGSLGPGATGTTLVLSGASTALQYISTQIAGADAFSATTNGARWHVGAGALDYFSSDGTTITFAGDIKAPIVNVSPTTGTTGWRLISVGDDLLIQDTNGVPEITIDAATGNVVFYAAVSAAGILSGTGLTLTTTGGPNYIVGSTTAAGAGGNTPAVAAIPSSALDAGDMVFGVGTNVGTISWGVLFNGNSTQLAGDFVTGSGSDVLLGRSLIFSSYTDDSGTAGNRTVNKVRGKNAIAALAATCVITNSFVTANSQVICTLEESDATATIILRVIPGAGSFTLTVNAAATADTTFSWIVLN